MMSKKLLLALPLAVLLGACGGGGGDAAEEAAARTVPASAMASPEAFVRYAASLVADDKAEPLELAQLQPPVSETAEPVDLQ